MNIVFDIGGTNMRLARADGGTISEPLMLATPPRQDEGLRVLSEAITSLANEKPRVAGGVAGVLEDGVLYRSPNLPGWDGARIAEALAPVAKDVQVRNDAALACLGEARYGAGKDARIVAYLSVGTGVGGARAVNGVLDPAAYNFEPGHQIVDATTGATLEELVAGGPLTKQLGMPPEQLPREELEKRMPILAAGIVNALMLWSPDVLVLGGSVVNDETGYRLKPLIEEIAQRQKMFPKLPEIRRAELGDQSALYGAMALLER